MGNNRKAARVRFEHKHTVNIMGVDGTWQRSCILLDASTTGAQLEVEGSTEPLKAQEFFLVLSSTGLAFRRCELIWVNGATCRRALCYRKDKGQGKRRETSRKFIRQVLNMQLISSRNIPFIDTQSLSVGYAREALLHDNRKGFILYLSSGERSCP
jgi:hypothetical protein